MFFDTISDGLHYLHKDHLGSIVCITDTSGNIEEPPLPHDSCRVVSSH
ncbi:MAG: hypothetical protein H6536_00650 [Bacteroidales bacterium]|nr:hypothetical protein [Bacteroidales bacterium]